MRQQLHRRARVILTSMPNQRAYWHRDVSVLECAGPESSPESVYGRVAVLAVWASKARHLNDIAARAD